MRCHWRLFVTITPLLRSMEGTCHGQVCRVVLVVHLVLSVLAALGLGHTPLFIPRTVSVLCVLHCDVVCNNHSPTPIYGGYLPRTGVYCGVCCVVLSVLAALGMSIGYMWCMEHIYVLAICLWGARRAPDARGEWPL